MLLDLPEGMANPALVIGRIFLGGLFVFGGLSHFPEIEHISGAMRARGVPIPRTALLAGTFWQILFGALLMIGVVTALASLALALFVILATIMMLNFWDL